MKRAVARQLFKLLHRYDVRMSKWSAPARRAAPAPLLGNASVLIGQLTPAPPTAGRLTAVTGRRLSRTGMRDGTRTTWLATLLPVRITTGSWRS